MPPPQGWPPILLSLDYAQQQPPIPEQLRSLVRYDGAQLRIAAEVPEGNQGVAADQRLFRDVTIQAEVSLAVGGDDDLYGLFVRSPSPELYYAFAVSPTGQVVISQYDGRYEALVAGPLDPELPFNSGLGRPNRFEVLALGPALTFLLNGMVISPEIVDPRFSEGYLGFYIHHGTQSPRAELAADWIQVRGIFPEGPPAGVVGAAADR